MTHQLIHDKIQLKELVDRISVLGDQKDFTSQVRLFTEHAVSETIAGGKTVLKVQGRERMANAFAELLKDVETVYHGNGQQVLSVQGDHAAGICYCLITLTGTEEGKKIMTTIGATYQDDYIRINNQWFVEKRVGTFAWQNKIEMIS